MQLINGEIRESVFLSYYIGQIENSAFEAERFPGFLYHMRVSLFDRDSDGAFSCCYSLSGFISS